MKNRTLFLLVLSLFLASASAAYANPMAAETRWQDVNFDPYVGTAENAVAQMMHFGLPSDTAHRFLEMIKRGKFRKGTIYKGERYLLMMSGKNTVKKNILTDWRHFVALESEDYVVDDFVIRRPTICNNWLLGKRNITVPEKPEITINPQPRPPEKAVSGIASPTRLYTIRINVVEWSDYLNGARSFQSRDIGPLVREGMGLKAVRPYTAPARFRIEWRAGGRYLAGQRVVINGAEKIVMPEFNDRYYIEVETSGGQATLTLDADLIKPETQIFIWPQAVELLYPPMGSAMLTLSGELHYYATRGCGGRPCNETFFHFIAPPSADGRQG